MGQEQSTLVCDTTAIAQDLPAEPRARLFLLIGAAIDHTTRATATGSAASTATSKAAHVSSAIQTETQPRSSGATQTPMEGPPPTTADDAPKSSPKATGKATQERLREEVTGKRGASEGPSSKKRRMGPTALKRSHGATSSPADDTTTTLEEDIRALFDGDGTPDLIINFAEQWLAEEAGWPMVMSPGWVLHTAVGKDSIYGTCPNVPLVIFEFQTQNNVFVSPTLGYDLILGQPWRAKLRYTSIWKDDGSEVKCVSSLDGEQTVQFRVVSPTDDRHRVYLKYRGEGPPPELADRLRELEGRDKGVPGTAVAIEGSFDRRGEGVVAKTNTMYKTVDRKVCLVAHGLLPDAGARIERAIRERRLRDLGGIGHCFTAEASEKVKVGGDGLLTQQEEADFREMLGRHGRAFAFKDSEIGCADPAVVAPMVIFMDEHEPWALKSIGVPRAMQGKLEEFLKRRMATKVLEPASGPYACRWFMVLKKDGGYWIIQDCRPLNAVTIWNASLGPTIEEAMDGFAGRAIYSFADLFCGYDQFQLEERSRVLAAMRTPFALLGKAVVPQGGTNSVCREHSKHDLRGVHTRNTAAVHQ
ncbi:MAG: hypothetical protein BJ554DRAFT_3778 [Olpidium bornovanus]|uniref:Reverse transcriptase domain-containing protein n=1 Tax=Olpidium bornovanus TaxID=278681 RepID=A0A8H8A081_9FUNG|nr:MAG: hypothetical protein BJ554DRAFT_3778 [Olpidium bornovanus]